ncbi:unnamed protein product [Amoebophrya sp. A25]|nr:unnamed protein product [Amoebophrya sp. A25]|eukprot:GSA25T00020318001.1
MMVAVVYAILFSCVLELLHASPAIDLATRLAKLEDGLNGLYGKLNDVGIKATKQSFEVEEFRQRADELDSLAETTRQNSEKNQNALHKIGSFLNNSRAHFGSDLRGEKALAKEAARLTPLVDQELSQENKDTVKSQVEVLTQMQDPGSDLSIAKLGDRAESLLARWHAAERQVHEAAKHVVAEQAVPGLERVRKAARLLGRRSEKGLR